MLPYRSYQSRRPESIIKRNIDKNKQSKSKSKKLTEIPTTQVIRHHIPTSPKHKELIDDKENVDVVQNVLKIMSAAADSKEKEILIGLSGQIEREYKLKSMIGKESSTDASELHSMLAHIRVEQNKYLSSLKIEIGKRKLQNLDEHDLRQDILNLNSYIMRRTKKDTMIIKNQGIDLINEIYNKFDEQAKIINELLTAIESNNKKNTKQKSYKELIFKNEDKNGIEEECKLGEHRSEVLLNDCKNNSQELMQKIVDLEKENLKLTKDIVKIEEEFEYVVEEKLILEERLERVSKTEKEAKILFIKAIKQLKESINEIKEGSEENRHEICHQLELFNIQIQQQKQTFMEEPNQEATQLIESEKSIEIDDELEDLMEAEMIIPVGLNLMGQSMESECLLMEKYEATMAEKEMEINKYLKVIGRLSEEKGKLEESLFEQSEKLAEMSIDLNFKNKQINTAKTKFLSFITPFKKDLQTLANLISNQFFHFQLNFSSLLENGKWPVAEMIRQVQEQLSKKILDNEHLESVLKNKEIFEGIKSEKEELKIKIEELEEKIRSQWEESKIEREKLLEWNEQRLIEFEIESNRKSIQTQQEYEQQKRNAAELQTQLEEEKQTSLESQSLYQEQIQLLQTLLREEEQKNKNNLGHLLTQAEEKYKKEVKAITEELQKIMNEQETSENERKLALEEKETCERNILEENKKLSNEIHRLRIECEHAELTNLNRETEINGYIEKINSLVKNIKELEEQLAELSTKYSSMQSQMEDQETRFGFEKQENNSEFGKLLEMKTEELQAIALLKEREQIQKEDLLSRLIEQANSKIHPNSDSRFKIEPLKQKLTKIKICSYELQREMSKMKDEFSQALSDFNFQLNERIGNRLSKCKELTNEKGENEHRIIEENLEEEKSLKLRSPLGEEKDMNSFLESEESSKFFNFLECLSDFNIDDILNQSSLVPEIEALNLELAESYKKNKKLAEELKVYQQKDMDKIFDF